MEEGITPAVPAPGLNEMGSETSGKLRTAYPGASGLWAEKAEGALEAQPRIEGAWAAIGPPYWWPWQNPSSNQPGQRGWCGGAGLGVRLGVRLRC